MASHKMHSDEVPIDVDLVGELLKIQFPQWAHLPLEIIYPEGTDNKMYRLGDDMIVRLPRMKKATANIEKEIQWLPHLAPLLTLKIPTVLGVGKPSLTYPFPWLVGSWLVGESPYSMDTLDFNQAALDLGKFITALHKINLSEGPVVARGQPLSVRDQETQEAIILLKDIYDKRVLLDIWKSALAAPQWKDRPRWIHGDLHAGNILVEKNRITAIVDFGSMGVGDPACDLMAAWTLLDAKSRKIFRSNIDVSDATWNRGRGWAFTMGIVAYPYYKVSNPLFAGIAKRAIDEVLMDVIL